MDCPYLDCPAPDPLSDAAACPRCRRFLKRCECRAPNRSFARFCRSCGRALDTSAGWNGRRGGGRALGLVPEPIPNCRMEHRPVLRFQLGGACRGLLMRDGWLIAVSRDGDLAAANLYKPEEPLRRVGLGRRIIAHPALEGDVLYVGVDGALLAFTLLGLASTDGEIKPLWDHALDGSPVQALTPAFGHLYFHLMRPGRRKELYLLPDAGSPAHGVETLLDPSGTAGPVAVEPTTRTAHYLTRGEDGWQLNLVRHSLAGGFEVLPGFTPGGMSGAEGNDVPGDTAVVGLRLYTVRGDDAGPLVRVNLQTRFVDQNIPEAGTYALASPNEIAVIRPGGVHFSQFGVTAEWHPGDLPVLNCPPVIWRNSLLAAGLASGDIALFRWDNPNLQAGINPFGGESRQEVSTLAGWREFLAVGNHSGHVEAFSLS